MPGMENQLASESSPYLRQHAGNPVHWQPWGPEALESARTAGKPILLSIGYASCHWCHVMAHESFEDPATAAVMNEHFINIKVDREERPDIDRVYQLAHQVLTRSGGGWPLTMFLDPDKLTPFFGGTYFPRTPRLGLPGFSDLLMRIADVFRDKRDELIAQGDKVVDVLLQMNAEAADARQTNQAVLNTAREELAQQYDREDGGFGDAPKFAMPATLRRVLCHWSTSIRHGKRDRDGLDIVLVTLTQLSRGGIFDHVGGGFFRYATDRRWRIPHFEKMLIDNGLLLALFGEALEVGPDPLLQSTARETARWMLREMQHPAGGFYSALDADSEGEEGRFYVWRREQVKRLLTEDEYLLVETLYGLDKPANFENHWNFWRTDSWRSVVHRLSLDNDEALSLLASARRKLFSARLERVPPDRDEKILTAANGAAIHGLTLAGRILDEPEYIDAARAAAEFIRQQLFADGQLASGWAHGKVSGGAYLDDYAFLMEGLLSLLKVEWRDEIARFLKTLADQALDRFEDQEGGGFFFSAHDAEVLLYRPKPMLDDAVPPGNAIIARVLLQLGDLFAEPRYLTAAARTLACGRSRLEQMPAGHCAMLDALEAEVSLPETVVLRGPKDEAEEWRSQITHGFKPWRRIYVIPYQGVEFIPSWLPRLVSAAQRDTVTAFVCSGLECSLPMRSLDALRETLGGD